LRLLDESANNHNSAAYNSDMSTAKNTRRSFGSAEERFAQDDRFVSLTGAFFEKAAS
jgi:hypothetical protein